MGAENLSRADAGQRDAKRARVLLTAKLRTAHGTVDARLRDLSRKGALVECKQRLPVGEELVFARGDTIVPARVAWAGGNRIGIEFLEQIEESEVLVHIGRTGSARNGSGATSYGRCRRPPINQGLTDYERKLAQIVSRSLGVQLIDE